MKYVEMTIAPAGGGWFQAVDRQIAADPALRHGPVHEITLKADATVVVLYEVHGDPAQASELYDGLEDPIYLEMVAEDEVTFVFAQYEPSPIIQALLEILREYRLVLDRPLQFVDDNRIRVVVVSDAATLTEGFAALSEDANLSIERTGEYRPTRTTRYGALTERQQQILRVALDLGYYDTPRRATHEDISAELDVSASTVGDHLRKIEGTVLRDIAPAHG